MMTTFLLCLLNRICGILSKPVTQKYIKSVNLWNDLYVPVLIDLILMVAPIFDTVLCLVLGLMFGIS